MEKRYWDLFLSCILFDIQETRQEATGSTPFELLLSSCPQGLLSMTKKAWEEQQYPFHSFVEFDLEIQEWIDWIAMKVCQHIQEAHAEQNLVYNWLAQTHEFQPGDCMLLLLHNTSCKYFIL